jgi:tRNA-splicing ligase RtcB (3'-phosphate/5'-hydroxy nucleic acid ligase)
VRAVGWGQGYARVNRELMMEAILEVLRRSFPDLATGEIAVNCHHNYLVKEQHFGKDVWLTPRPEWPA